MEWTRRVEASPAEVWDAIATGNGISSWFVPAKVDPGVGGEIRMQLGPGMESPARITEWHPPERLVYEEDLVEEGAAEPQPLFTEFIVESGDDGTTTLRLICHGDAEGEGMDELFESMDEGWGSFLDNLAIYLSGYAGEICGSMMVDATPDLGPEDAFEATLAKLGLSDAAPGDPAALDPGAGGSMSGEVVRRKARDLAIKAEIPVPGIIEFGAFAWGDETHVRIHVRQYGEGAAEAAAAASGAWLGWLSDLFPEDEVASL
ncbi:MAG TPA: SRPBCC domain-containing protein [Solirubrobacterales bacterium]|nr:SRPBCC domain-containing protein [Solirubrobacterales bacterium]